MIRALPLLLALAACAGPPDALRAPAVMPDPECRAFAMRDSEVRATFREINPENPEFMRRLASERAEAQQRAYNSCARERGLPVPGGVERIRPTS
jgi:hypothetical protein